MRTRRHLEGAQDRLPGVTSTSECRAKVLRWTPTLCLILLISISCQDPQRQTPNGDATVSDGSFARSDQTPTPDVRHPIEPADQGLPDQFHSAADAHIPLADTLTLSIDNARIEGSHSRLTDGRVLLDRGARIVFSLDEHRDGGNAQWVAVFRGQLWRFEDGLVDVGFGDDLKPALIQGDGLSTPVVMTEDYPNWQQSPSIEKRLPPPLEWAQSHPDTDFTLVAREGGLIIQGIDLVDSRDVDTVLDLDSDLDDTVGIEFVACADEPDCDDGARLTALIEGSNNQDLTIRLVSASYRARTPVHIRRDHVHLIGGSSTDFSRPTWTWDPNPDLGQRWAFDVRGQGVATELYFSLLSGIESGQRRFTIEGNVPADTKWMRLTADDFGDVPPVCIDGRDVERTNRHQRQLFRVLDVQARDDITEIILDRAINLTIPSSANPRLSVVRLLEGVSLTNIELRANCPDALNQQFREANCENPGVLDDGGVLALYTSGVHLERLHGQGFGKFTIEIRDALLSRVIGCSMDHPAAYGSGGQGYGVHLIGASRTVVERQTVDAARHGVVVDFGSSDSQVLRGIFSNMNQALIDIHGEASRDTLVRGNRMQSGSIGVIVGGGGRTVHCNDGPRHHIIDNDIQDINIAGVSVTDYTHEVFIRSNTIDDSSGHVIVSFGAQQVLIERNLFGEAVIASIALSFDDVRDVFVRRNVFSALCSATDTFLTVGAAQPPTFADNLFCPEISSTPPE